MEEIVEEILKQYKTISVITLIILLIYAFITCYFSINLQTRKGYTANYILAFFLGIIYLIYSSGLPDNNKNSLNESSTNKQFNNKKDYYSCPDCGFFPIYMNEKQCPKCGKIQESFILCQKCGFPVYPDEDKCSYCKEPNLNHKKKN